MLQFIKHLVQIVFSPAKGWEDLEHDSDERFLAYRSSTLGQQGGTKGASFVGERSAWEEQEAQRVFLRCFLPLIVVCALSEFTAVVYGTMDAIDALLHAAISFMTLFLASQVARYALLSYCPKLVDMATDPASLRGRWFMFVMFPLAFLAIVSMLGNLVKVHIALLGFLPFYVVFIIWKGWRYAGIDERKMGVFMIVATASVVGAVYLLEFVLKALL